MSTTDSTPPRRASDHLEHLRTINPEALKLHHIVDALHEGGFSLMLILFAAPLALPLPALGIAQVMALPLLFLSAQLAMGRKSLWLPQKLAKKSIDHASFMHILDKALPWLHRIERLLHPRLRWLSGRLGHHLIGVACMLCSISVAMPVPFSNTVPSMGIVLMAIGLLERDGLVQLAGVLVGAGGITLALAIYFVGIEAFRALIGW